MDWETRHKKYLRSPLHIQEMYASPQSGELLSRVAEKYNIPEAAYKAYATVVGDVILGIEPRAKLSDLLQENVGISSWDAQKINEDLSDFLSPLTDTQAPIGAPVDTSDEESPILKATRTMQEDVAEANHEEGTPQWRTIEEDGSEAEENLIPSYSKPLTDTPKYE